MNTALPANEGSWVRRTLSLVPRLRKDRARAGGDRPAPDGRAPASDGNAKAAVDAARKEAGELYTQGRYDAAAAILGDVVRRADASALDRSRLAWALLLAGSPVEAEPWFRAALAEERKDADDRFGLALALRRCGRAAEALIQLRLLVALRPEQEQYAVAYAELAYECAEYDVAEREARRVLEITPDSASMHALVGMVAFRHNNLEEAIARYERAAALESAAGAPGGTATNLGIALVEAGRNQEAIDVLTVALASKPDAYGAYVRSLALLRSGRFAEGWRAHEVRWETPAFTAQRVRYAAQEWRGEDINGRTILLSCEQGYGDTFQFIRYASVVAARGANVWVKAHAGIESLVARVPGVTRVLARDERPGHVDYFVNLMSLPFVLRTQLPTIPATIPYITGSPERIAHWEGRLQEVARPRVGLVWAGNPAHVRDAKRSLPFAMLHPLARIRGAHFVPLQVGDAARSAAGAQLFACEPVLHDFEDTAAVLALLDLVIAVDTAVAHLAGAMGKEVWLLLPFVADFRWMERRGDSPWYPTMRLFRQPVRGEWEAVVAAVGTELERWITTA